MTRRLWIVAALVALAPLLSASTGSVAQRRRARVTRLAAASDLRFALDELVIRLRQVHPDIELQVSYGSSGTLFAQLTNGAPFDLFMSADIEYPRQLVARGVAVPGSEFTYAAGHLVLWVAARSALDIEKQGMQALADPRVTHVAIANPATAPYGRAAEAAIRRAGVYDVVKPKLVLGENVAQALQFTQSGAADVGIVALSLASAPTVASAGRLWNVPADLYPRLEQGGVILRSAGDAQAAREVRDFLMSDAARTILNRFGFFLPDR